MTKTEHQELINKLAKIGYGADEEDKNAVFLAIAASYSLSHEKLDILNSMQKRWPTIKHS